ncbi:MULTISPECIES: DUF692 domain-containing protein [unclassified Psychrobacter]|uniref:HvfB family MNIO-type RiPP peptide maturase n=1 Tax=unclassified Psychrobacter TaxID=196806 RepID=UPI0025B2E059|nr:MULTISPECIES: DUF692 domain-containing protein [unclassified Psychrobacter]MDN3452818.1 DUF692 domain-containing protein [Psychrobacter sp. APC 3350]MDN3502761.1 DUF692 domain-containing protein [Psychrobacter sp. 5A.1]
MTTLTPARSAASPTTFGHKRASGAGLGLRRELLPAMQKADLSAIDFFELSPENWLNSEGQVGGSYAKRLRAYTERYPFVCHGLSLSIGSTADIDTKLLKNIKAFMSTHGIDLYTEHLSWCSDESGHLYDLLPIPCTSEAVHWVADRIKRAQDIMGRQIGFENASYYFTPPHAEMSDAEFITAVADEADCLLHLDVNNIYVNSQNFGFDPHAYLRQLPLERTCYMHVAGHHIDEDGLIIDTHGMSVVDPVWALLADAYALIEHRTGRAASTIPTCLERDFNFPTLSELTAEVDGIRRIQSGAYGIYGDDVKPLAEVNQLTVLDLDTHQGGRDVKS